MAQKGRQKRWKATFVLLLVMLEVVFAEARTDDVEREAIYMHDGRRDQVFLDVDIWRSGSALARRRWHGRKQRAFECTEAPRSATDATATSSLQKRGGKMGRHLVAAAAAATMAMGTAAMGVTTYALRLSDFNAKRRRDAAKKGRKAKGMPDSPDSPKFKTSSKSSAQQPSNQKGGAPNVFVTNVIVNPSKEGTAPSSITINLPSPASFHKREVGLVKAFTKEFNSLSRTASSRLSRARSLIAEGARAVKTDGRAAVKSRGLDEVVSSVAKSVSPKTGKGLISSRASTAFHKTAKIEKDPDARIFGVDVTKYSKWAPFLAKVEDYGKMSAATGAFTAGAISLHTAVRAHAHELEEHPKEKKD